MSGRPAGLPAVGTLFKSLNILGTGHPIDKREAVFFTECHLDVKVLWCDGHHAFLPTTARGAW